MHRMKTGCATLLSLLVLAACGPTEVVVSAELDLPDPETGERTVRPLTDLRVQLIPFDRDVLFDSLGAAADTPEPQLPAELAMRRDSIAEARQIWTESESEWLAARDRLQEIDEEIQQYSPAEAQYRVLVQEFDRFNAQMLQAERVKDEAFERFDTMQREAFAELEAFNAQLMSWEDQAFEDWDLAVAERIAATGQEILTDTTDATGRAVFAASPGSWWVHARQPETTDELYWNVPVTIEGAEPVEIQLNRGNAQIRPIY